MKEKHKILQKIDEYLDNATPEQIEKDWAELEKYNHDGPEVVDIVDKINAIAKPRSEEAIKRAEERKRARDGKKLLLRYLCMALPYGVKGETLGYKTCTLTHLGKEGDFTADDYHGWLNSGQFIPYLRPMSSITEEESGEWAQVEADEYGVNDINWLLANHFDFMGLIPIGEAIEVTVINNPYKE